MSNITGTVRPKSVPDTEGARLAPRGDDITTPGVAQDLISYTVPASKAVRLLAADLSCRTEGVLRVKVDGTTVVTKRTAAQIPNVSHEWLPFDELATGVIIILEFTAAAWTPAGAPVECGFQARLVDV